MILGRYFSCDREYVVIQHDEHLEGLDPGKLYPYPGRSRRSSMPGPRGKKGTMWAGLTVSLVSLGSILGMFVSVCLDRKLVTGAFLMVEEARMEAIWA